MHFVRGNELITSAVDCTELSSLAWKKKKTDLEVGRLWSLCEVADSAWPLGLDVNIVALCSAHPNLLLLFSFFLISQSFAFVVCGTRLTFSPWIKILINLRVSLPCYSWKGRGGETEEEREPWHMGSWDDRQSTTMASVCCVYPFHCWLILSLPVSGMSPHKMEVMVWKYGWYKRLWPVTKIA